MANEKNLIPFDERTESEQREIAQKGGIASGAARRRKRSLREAADVYLAMPVTDTQTWNQLAMDGVDIEDIDNQMAIIAGLSKRAMKGDAKAAKVVIELIGENTMDDPVEDQMAKARDLLEDVDSVID